MDEPKEPRGGRNKNQKFRTALQDVNWKTFLSSDCILPPDVLFHVKAEDGNDAEGSTTTIGAHKFLLAGGSSVFGGMFFGLTKETKEVIEVKDTSRSLQSHD